MDLVKTAPILCAGITMYSPLMHWGAGSGEKKTVGIVGIGKFNLTLFLAGGITKPPLPVYGGHCSYLEIYISQNIRLCKG